MHAARTRTIVLSVVPLLAVCMAQLILGATPHTTAVEKVAKVTRETSPLKKAGPPHDQYTMGIVTRCRSRTGWNLKVA
jgi:hypothetical protein